MLSQPLRNVWLTIRGETIRYFSLDGHVCTIQLIHARPNPANSATICMVQVVFDKQTINKKKDKLVRKKNLVIGTAAMIIITALVSVGNMFGQTVGARPVSASPPGTYWSFQHTNWPPMPFNQFSNLPVYTIGNRSYLIDDSSVDYSALQAQQSARASMSVPSLPGLPGGGSFTNWPVGGGGSGGNNPMIQTNVVSTNYTVIDLGTLPGGTQSFAQGINNKGQVVGYSNPSSLTNIHAFLYSGNGLMLIFDSLKS